MENFNSPLFVSGFFYMFIYFSKWNLSEATLKIHSLVPVKREVLVKIEFAGDPMIKRRKRSGQYELGTNLLPSKLNLTFKLGDQPITLQLTKNRKVDNVKIPIRTTFSDDSVFMHYMSALKHVGGYYQSDKDSANIHLQCVSNTTSVCTDYQVFGTFKYQNKHHVIEPYIQPIDLGRECEVHRIVETMPNKPFRIDHIPLPKGKIRATKKKTRKPRKLKLTAKQRNLIKKNAGKARTAKKRTKNTKLPKKSGTKQNQKFANSHARRKRATGSYVVEVYVVVDYQIYSFWLKEENYNENRAIQRIRQYFTFLFNGVDSRFRQIQASYRIEVTMVGLYIATTKSDLTFIDDNTSCFGSPPCRLNSNKAVADIKAWVQKKEIPQYDHIMTFTRHNMVTGTLDTSGSSYLNSICTSRSHSIVEEKFDFIAATVATHEIGHTLGAVHDGENNACAIAPHYIMVSVSSAMKRPYQRSPWQFSRCSIKEFAVLFDDIEMGNKRSCLQRRSPNAKNVKASTQRKLGQIFSIDKQCELIVGKGSYACRSFIGNGNYEDVCTGLWCKSIDTLASTCILALPVEGTSCGSNKLCNGYRCEYHPSAPSFPDGCIFKDIPGIILKQQTCSELIRTEPYQCYSQSIQKNCCSSCSRIKSNDPACLYGDKSLDCPAVVRRNQCSRYRSVCCKTCK